MTEKLEEILLDLAERLDLEQINHDEDGAWFLAFSQEDWLELEPDGERAVVTISQELAKPLAPTRPEIHAMALQYNFLWQETGGARLSLDGPDGALVLSLDIAESLGDADHLENAIRNFREVAQAWTDLIIQPPSEERDDAENREHWVRG